VDALEEAVADAEAAIAARDARESEETTPEAVGAPSEPAKATKAPSKLKKASKDKAPAKPKKSLFSGFGRKGTPPDETVAPTPPKDYSTYPEGQQKLLTLLAEGKKTADQLAAQTGMPVGDVLCELTMLEIGGEIGALPGGFYETV
jgi:predicted Rossmann fold nucleotide-binding protein DprA/Smf involved in DNA uptake